MLRTGELLRYLGEYAITGLTSNPSIFDHAFTTTDDYDTAISAKVAAGKADEHLFFELAMEDGAAAVVSSWNELLGVVDAKASSVAG